MEFMPPLLKRDNFKASQLGWLYTYAEVASVVDTYIFSVCQSYFHRFLVKHHSTNTWHLFEVLLHKITFFWEKTGSIWTVPSDLFAKKIHFLFYEVVDSC